METLESNQQAMFDKLASAYEMHYSDPCSQRYRDIFLVPPFLKGLTLKGKRVLDAMCGSGQMTGVLRDQGAHVSALDLSPKLVDQFRRRFPDGEIMCGSVLEIPYPDATFDHVFIAGGLHHIQPHVDAAMKEIARVLRPGGYFCFLEPHRASWPDLLRRLWYKLDRSHFEDNEQSIDIEKLIETHREAFTPKSITYGGGPAYILVFSSLIMRIPLWSKQYYTPFLLQLEKCLQPFQTRRLSCYIIGQFERTAAR